MICPYDAFKEKDCNLCAAFIELNKLDSTRISFERVCSLAWRSSKIPSKPLFYVPEYSPKQNVATEWR